MTEEKGLDSTSADKIGEYVKHKGTCLFGDSPVPNWWGSRRPTVAGPASSGRDLDSQRKGQAGS